MINQAVRDIHYALRTLRKNVAFTVTAVLTLALGIGATTAIYSVVHAVFEPMPYPKPDQLVMVWSKKQERNSVSTADFVDWKQRNNSFSDMNAWSGAGFNIATDDRPEQVAGSQRTPGFFTMEGLPMMLGRDFLPEEGQSGRDHVVILSNRLWSRHFSSNRNIIGKDIRMNGEPYTVVGVLPPGMHDRLNSQLWVPLVIDPQHLSRDGRPILVMARLKDGVSLQQAQADMDNIALQLQQEYPKTNASWTVSVEPLHLDFVTQQTQRNLWLLLGAVSFLLLIACVNVANLLLARGTTRQREVALRAALGASRKRLFAQFITESSLLAVAGGALGIVFAKLIVDAIGLVMPPVGTMLPSEADIRLSVPVLLFTIGVTAIAGLLFGSAPALSATRLDLNEVLKAGGRTGAGGTRARTRRLLVIAEFSLALTMLAAAGLALKSFWNLTRIDLGIRTDNVLSFRLPVPNQKLRGPDQMRSYYRQLIEKIRAVPEVKNLAVMTGNPARGTGSGRRFSIVGQPPVVPEERPAAAIQMVTPGYTETLAIRVTKGRTFDDRDTETGARVAMVNEYFASRYLNGVDPIDQRLVLDDPAQGAQRGQQIEVKIIGVFHDVNSALQRDRVPEIDLPFWQSPRSQASFVVQTEGDPNRVIKGIAAAVNSVDPDLPLAGVRSVDEIVAEAFAIDRFSVLLFASFGALGLLLAVVGIYGVISFAVAQRTQEFGLRMALGAQRSRVIRLVLKEATLLAGIGAAIGLGGAYFVGRAMQSTLFGVGALDLSAFAGVFALLLVAAWFACLFPAWRASRVDPMVALRYE